MRVNICRDFMDNFKCFTDRLGIKNLPISPDNKNYSYITQDDLLQLEDFFDFAQVSPSFAMPDLWRDKVDANSSQFGGGWVNWRKLQTLYSNIFNFKLVVNIPMWMWIPWKLAGKIFVASVSIIFTIIKYIFFSVQVFHPQYANYFQ